MTGEESPIIEYYPTEFKTDLNGKQQEWEAVVLIPFIDEVRPLLFLFYYYSIYHMCPLVPISLLSMILIWYFPVQYQFN